VPKISTGLLEYLIIKEQTMSLFENTFKTAPQYYWRLPLYFDFRDLLYISRDGRLTAGNQSHIQAADLVNDIFDVEDRA